jgi:ElaB/YqjD/DUF883 family membrane-anchored ribosome-binding protein
MNPKKTQKQLNDLKRDFNNLQNETKEIIKREREREINKIKKAAQNVKDKLKKYIDRGKSKVAVRAGNKN